MATNVRHIAVLTSIAAASTLAAFAAPAERAKPPVWTDADIAPFFPDAREALVGQRPTTSGAASAAVPAPVAPVGKFEWSRLIGADELATEVKRSAARLAAPLANAATFKSGGNNVCRAEFGLLAVLFGVIAEYDGDVRWQRDASALRDELVRASANCKSASDQSYAEAVERLDALNELVRGARSGGEPAPAPDHWSALADRTLLMQRMQRAMQEGVNPRMSDAATFAKAAADVRHEAQLLALLAEVISRAEYEFWDDDTFVDYSHDLGAAAGDLARAAEGGNYDAARAAAGRTSQACATCHDGYRL